MNRLALSTLFLLAGCGARSTQATDNLDLPDGGSPDEDGGQEPVSDAGGPSDCEGLGEAACLGASTDCVPVYDDACCPECVPAQLCADCADWRFFRCAAFEDSECVPGFVDACGQTPQWACSGGEATCEPPSDASPSRCGTVPGCVRARPDPIACEGCTEECHPVRAESCDAPECDHIPAQCGGGEAVESRAACDTGYCIPGEVCG